MAGLSGAVSLFLGGIFGGFVQNEIVCQDVFGGFCFVIGVVATGAFQFAVRLQITFTPQ